MENFLRLLHPVMPYLTEELYQKLPTFEWKKKSISLDEYPLGNQEFKNFDFQSFE